MIVSVQKILMPKLGESVTEGTINTWLVKEGDFVNKYDPIAEVMTDKVNAEVPSAYKGTIKEIVVAEGETVSVDELICYIETDEAVQLDSDNNKKESSKQEQPKDKEAVVAKKNIQTTDAAGARFSPAVVRLASEHNIDLSLVKGTGLGGRITRKDVLQVIEEGLPLEKEKQTPTVDVKKRESIATSVKALAHDREIPVTGVRKAIAENMVRAKTEIPHAWMTVEVDVTDLVNLREKVKEQFKQREGYSLTYFAFFVYAVSKALKEFPQLNSTWAGDKIIERSDIHLSIAVAKENELFVPVIKHADDKSIKGIAKSIHELAEKTRTGKLTQDDMTWGTFTVNNTGTFGSVSSMGIINYPQAAILQVEAIVKRPVIIDNMFAARDIVNLSLSLDHRILDGLICGRFLARVKEILENINQDTLEI